MMRVPIENFHSRSKINNLLICLAFLLILAALSCFAQTTSSPNNGGPIEDKSTEDNELKLLQNGSLMNKDAKPNKISHAMRMLHRVSSQHITKRDRSYLRNLSFMSRKHNSNFSPGGEEKTVDEQYKALRHHVLSFKSDDELLASVCGQKPSVTCKLAIKRVINLDPGIKRTISQAIRTSSDDVDPKKLLYHKLFETGIGRMEQLGLDSKIDSGINLLAKRNPYLWAANSVLNHAPS